MYLNCEAGYEHKGGDSVTCGRDGQLGYSTEPLCSKGQLYIVAYGMVKTVNLFIIYTIILLH